MPVFVSSMRSAAAVVRGHSSVPNLSGRFRAAALACFAGAVCLFAPLATTSQANAAVPAFVAPDDMHLGSLLLEGDEPGHYVEAPRVKTDVDITVSGPTARARVTQVFHNPTDGWVEGVYVYPLPQDSAVDTLKMVIGKRVIVGDIEERKKARADYEAAKAAGQKASLVEQQWPNIFTNSVANIGPHESVVVQIEYQEPVHQSGNDYSLRVPLVVAPRYNPAPVTETAEIGDKGGWGTIASDPVPDRKQISSPVLDPRKYAPVNPVTVSVHLDAGFPLGPVTSSTHAIEVTPEGEAGRLVRIKGPVPADRDFELTWQPAASKAPSVGLFREKVAGGDYALAYVTPPTLKDAEIRRNRDIVFVIDNSGSMGGSSIRQAKASLDYALRQLKPGDRFNVIRFDDTMTALFRGTVPADAGHISRARAFVGGIEAKGGTEMLAPLKTALDDHHKDGDKDVRQVVFLTDGAVGNEQQLLDTIARRLGRSHVFMVGIGSAPNTYLMSRAAEIGRGTFTHIGSTAEVESRMRALFDKLENPAVTNLTATFSAGGADVTPVHLPDLYRGEPIVLAARLDHMTGTLTLAGKIGMRPWSVALPLAKAAEGNGISKVWARRKIADAEVARTLGQISDQEADARILKLALQHHLVTRLTSLVAIDQTPSRPDDKPLTRAEVPLNLPAGWDFDKVFGRAPADRADAAAPGEHAGFREIKRSSAPVAEEPRTGAGLALPQTATNAPVELLAGFALLLAAALLCLLVLGRRVEA